ncbi:MAG TPA: response regulator transcription factor [Jatrophihabitantaceae bacterium]
MTRVVLADDQQLVRAGFRLILTHAEIEVVGEATTGEEAVEVTRQTSPDVVLMDIRMPDTDGIEATRRIVDGDETGSVRVLILTTFDLDEYVYDALQAGASGFLLKDAPPEQLVAAVESVVRGDTLLAPSITRRLVEEFAATRPRTRPQQLDQLSVREAEVFRLVARGLSNREISEHLFVGETTVKTHIARIFAKLEVRDRVQAVVLAYEAGVVQPGRD